MPSPLSTPVSVGVGVELSEPVAVGVGVAGVVVGVVVGAGDDVVGVGVGDVALADGVADPVAEGVGLAAAEDVAAHDGVGDGVGDGMRPAAVFGATEFAAAASSAVAVERSTLVQSTTRVAGQLAEGAGLADAGLFDEVVP